MSKTKDKIINAIIEVEGGYVNDPDDSGGETRYGITEKVARRYSYTGPMQELPRDLAFRIYSDWYWDSMHLDQVEQIAAGIAEELADTAVNMGVNRAATFLQRSLNALNNRQQYYADITVDGDVGNRTLEALGSYIAERGDEGITTLRRMLNALQGAFYVELSERREKDEAFIFGWFKNRIS
jgi:lysozyme family protein